MSLPVGHSRDERHAASGARFASRAFLVAGACGLAFVTPLFFLRDYIGASFPPAVTHPEIYFGFVTVTFAWQVAFVLMAGDPIRFRPLMPAAILEKFAYVAAIAGLHARGDLPWLQVAPAVPDFIFGLLFIAAFVKTAPRATA